MAGTPLTPEKAKTAAADAIKGDAKKVELTKQADGNYVVKVTK